MTQPNSLTLEFSNPVEIDDDQFSNIMGLDFDNKKSKPDDNKDDPKFNPNPTIIDNKDKEEGEGEGEEDNNKDKSGLSLNPSFNTDEGEEEDSTDSNIYVDLINSLADEVGFTEVFEGFDQDAEPTKETLVKFIEHNASKKAEESISNFFESLTPATKKLIMYDINSKGDNVESYIQSLVEENNIKSLSVDNEYDQEKIVRFYYSNEDSFTSEEVEEKITELKEAGLLEKESKRLKPKLDQKAESIVKQQEESQRQLRELEQQRTESYNNKVVDVLKQGVLKGIKLNKDEISTVYSFLTDDKIDMVLPGNKKVKMSPLEAVIYYNKYEEKGSVENLALATLLLVNPQKFDEYYAKKATTEVTNQFVKEKKWNDSLKIGGEPLNKNTSQSSGGKKQIKKEVENTQYKWNLNIK